ncbi:MAG: glutamate racemase [Gammaproteobacteria bacterium]
MNNALGEIRAPGPLVNSGNLIGIFDSGVGGLAIFRAIREVLPHHELAYFADSKYCPYGNRSSAEIVARAMEVSGFLVGLGAQALVVACNTATVHAVAALRERYGMPIIGIEPGIKPAAAISGSRRVVVLATPRTLESSSVSQLRDLHGSGTDFILQPCPGLVELIEAGQIEEPATMDLLRRFVRPVIEGDADAVVLGCTHFIYLEDKIRMLAGRDISIIEPSRAVAAQLARRLASAGLGASTNGLIEDRFFTSASNPVLISAVASRLLCRDIQMLGVDDQAQNTAA